MHFMYVDESGDSGEFIQGVSKNSRHYILSGLIVPQDDWLSSLERLKTFRASIKQKFGLRIREEIHASELIRINKNTSYRSIRKTNRIEILSLFLQTIPVACNSSRIINVCFDKTTFPLETKFQDLAWSRLIQRYDTFLKKTVNDKGIIISDATDEPKVRQLVRKMRVYNPVPSHFGGYYQIPTDNILEDPFLRDSRHSYYIQVVDAIVHSLYRKEFPKGSLKKFKIEQFFKDLQPILVLDANKNDANGIVRK